MHVMLNMHSCCSINAHSLPPLTDGYWGRWAATTSPTSFPLHPDAKDQAPPSSPAPSERKALPSLYDIFWPVKGRHILLPQGLYTGYPFSLEYSLLSSFQCTWLTPTDHSNQLVSHFLRGTFSASRPENPITHSHSSQYLSFE